MPHPVEDPFPLVQREVRTAWADLSASIDRLPAAERRKRIQALEFDVHDLSEAIRIARQDRKRFNLSEQELASREHFVAEMQRNLTSAEQRANKPAWDDPRVEEARRANDVFIGDEMRQQELIIGQQDEQLDELATAVERIGVLGRDMHLELEEQGQLLDDFGGEFDETMSRMKRVRQRLDRFIEQTGPRQFCTIVTLCITFMVLTFLVVTT